MSLLKTCTQVTGLRSAPFIKRESLTGQATFEQSTPEWEQWNAGHLPSCRLIAKASSHVLGWAALSPVSKRHVYSGVAEVSVYIAEQARGKGIGFKLLTALVKASESHGIWTLQAGIFPENKCQRRASQTVRFSVRRDPRKDRAYARPVAGYGSDGTKKQRDRNRHRICGSSRFASEKSYRSSVNLGSLFVPASCRNGAPRQYLRS